MGDRHASEGMEFPLRSAQVQAALDAGKPLLSGKRSIACMGDLLTLASFSLVAVVSQSLVGAYTTQSEAAAVCQQKSPDLLFVTENLEQGYGLSLARHVKEFSPKTRTLVFLHRETQAVVREALEAFVEGVMFVSSLGKGVDGDFIRSLAAIADGGNYYPKEVKAVAGYESVEVLPDLTDREMEVLRVLSCGLSNKEVSESLFISAETVKSHVSTIIGKMGVKDRTQAVIKAIRAGI